MNIVEATENQIVIIKSLSDKVWPVTFRDILSEEQIKYMMNMMYSEDSLRKQMKEGHHYLLAEEDGEYLGYLSYELNYKGSDITKVHKIYVLSSLQGRGVGRFFIDKAGEIAKNNNNKELLLNVNRFNRAIDFYKRVGFEIVRNEDIDIGNGFLMEDYVMNKKI
ncbi:MAG: GNAT family N-acetyltransferase [Prevotella sp.]|jgi:GNAT superfamily N-acetyltransferase|nr:GNAT family N-acetyltransferase [Prevotella sp.]